QAGDLLAAEGWAVEETQPPELERVTEIWAYLLTHDISEMMPALMELMSEGPIRSLNNLIARYQPSTMPGLQVHTERNRLCRLWSEFFTDYPAMIGPTWCDLPFLHDADIDEETGIDLVINTLRFITPGNVLGLPSVALPMGVADGLPTGVQVYADRWREDICLDTAEIIEGQRPPVWPPRG
ncbi:MAG: amidase family protein, partial [Pseudomonadales bacterium]